MCPNKQSCKVLQPQTCEDRHVGLALQAIRTIRKFSIAQLSGAVGITVNDLLACEQGSRPVYIEELEMLSNALAVDLETFSSLISLMKDNILVFPRTGNCGGTRASTATTTPAGQGAVNA